MKKEEKMVVTDLLSRRAEEEGEEKEKEGGREARVERKKIHVRFVKPPVEEIRDLGQNRPGLQRGKKAPSAEVLVKREPGKKNSRIISFDTSSSSEDSVELHWGTEVS